MVCPDKKPKGKLHVYFNGKDMGEVEPYIQTDEDVRIANLLLARRLLTPRFTVPIKYQPLYVMRAKTVMGCRETFCIWCKNGKRKTMHSFRS